MKRNYLGALVVGSIAVLTVSCKKDWSCSCTTVTTGTINATVTGDTILTDLTKKDAESKCSSFESSFSFFGESATTTCELE